MTAHTVHIFSLTDFSYLASIPVQGTAQSHYCFPMKTVYLQLISEDIFELSPLR